MKINSIDKYRIQPSMQAGLYFCKTSNVIFNKNANYKTEEIVKISQDGFKYTEETRIPQIIKEKFAKIPFIKNLAEKFDTFIFFSVKILKIFHIQKLVGEIQQKKLLKKESQREIAQYHKHWLPKKCLKI